MDNKNFEGSSDFENILPDALISEVFSKLEIKDLASVRRTSKKMRDICYNYRDKIFLDGYKNRLLSSHGLMGWNVYNILKYGAKIGDENVFRIGVERMEQIPLTMAERYNLIKFLNNPKIPKKFLNILLQYGDKNMILLIYQEREKFLESRIKKLQDVIEDPQSAIGCCPQQVYLCKDCDEISEVIGACRWCCSDNNDHCCKYL